MDDEEEHLVQDMNELDSQQEQAERVDIIDDVFFNYYIVTHAIALHRSVLSDAIAWTQCYSIQYYYYYYYLYYWLGGVVVRASDL